MSKLCETCNITLGEHDFASHVLGKKHLKKMEIERNRRARVEKSIIVSGPPPDLITPNLVRFFRQFGPIERFSLESSFAIIYFRQIESVNFVLSNPIWIGGHKLEIKKNNTPDSCPTNQQLSREEEKISAEIAFADLKTQLQSITTFESELATFLGVIQLNEEEVEKVWKSVHSSLFETVQPTFPHCEISRFGSSVTGLGFKGSDFDMYLNIGQSIYEENRQGPTLRRVFKEVKTLLYKNRLTFNKIVQIPKAKTPIIKFCHVPTLTNCDLSFKNGLGVINSELIKKLISLDARLKPIMIIIKFWASTFQLSGCGKLSNYAVAMLIIFFLQQPDVKLLPPIAELQKTCEPIYCWNWQVNFDRNAVFPPSTNTSTIAELLLGFFKFYAAFPFEKSLISPLGGCPLSRTDFWNACVAKGMDANYWSLNKAVCVQDPIELDSNLTAFVSAKVLETFQRFCAIGVEVCEVAVQNQEKPFLLNLFTTAPLPVKSQRVFNEIVILARKTLEIGLPKDFDTRTDIKDKDKFVADNWHSMVQKLVVDILTRVCKLVVQEIKSDRETKQQKVAATSDVHSNENDKITFECTGSYSLIADRKSKGFCIDPSLSHIDKEALISDELVKKQKESGVKSTKIDFTCTIIRENNPIRLVLRLTDRSSAKKQFNIIACFLSTKLPFIVDKELMHMLQFKKL